MTSCERTAGCAIVGAGFMGQTYARTLSTLVQGARLAAVAGGARAEALAADYGVPAEPNLPALLARPDVDILCIATPHAYHGEQALAALHAGKHVLIDKPMATTLEACDAILAAAEERTLRVEITYTQRERICNIETKRLLDTKALGALRHMRNTQVVPNGMATTPSWQLNPENVGILIGHAVHNIDQVRWLTGREVVKVFAKVGRFDPRYEVDSTADLILTLDDETVCTVFCSFEVPTPGIPRTGGSTQAICERGIIDSDWYGECRVTRDGGPWEIAAQQPPIDWAGKGFLDPVRLETYAAALQRLVDGVRRGDHRSQTAWDGRQAVAIALAAYESSRTGREISL